MPLVFRLRSIRRLRYMEPIEVSQSALAFLMCLFSSMTRVRMTTNSELDTMVLACTESSIYSTFWVIAQGAAFRLRN